MNILSDGKSAGIVLFYADKNSHLRTVYLTREQADSVDALLSIALKDTLNISKNVMMNNDGTPIVVNNTFKDNQDNRKPTGKQMAWIRDIEEYDGVPKFTGTTIKDAADYITKYKDAYDEMDNISDWALRNGYF